MKCFSTKALAESYMNCLIEKYKGNYDVVIFEKELDN